MPRSRNVVTGGAPAPDGPLTSSGPVGAGNPGPIDTTGTPGTAAESVTRRSGRPARPSRSARSSRSAGPSRSSPTGPGVLDAGRLDAFFADHSRDLPWRRPDASPWSVLVSEVMLQQTPVTRVLPVYREWMWRWPTPGALAAAPSGEAVRAWGRLGYPRRALRLHAAAQQMVDRHGGQVPADLAELLALPGVGEYTARAVAAFAFHARVPVVDTNVRRVLSRAVRGIDEHAPATATDREELERLLPADPAAAARFSVAMMELGALVCTAARPDCARCPLVADCAWVLAGRPSGPARGPGQAWHGTDRQVRGAIMAILRDADQAVPEASLVVDGVDERQWRRCLDSLHADGLATRTPEGRWSLPGMQG